MQKKRRGKLKKKREGKLEKKMKKMQKKRKKKRNAQCIPFLKNKMDKNNFVKNNKKIIWENTATIHSVCF